ncbi:MAG TPA: septum site-determining protein MinC [Caulobacteraceae bacterium]|nr:septum site-determining protein MinC [Caulobacteraceae bacterium]
MYPEALPLPKIQVRGRSFLALTVAPEAPLERWFEALDDHMARSAGFFVGQPVVAALDALALIDEAARTVLEALDGLVARGLRVIGIEGIDAVLLAGTRWQGLPAIRNGRDVARGAEELVSAPAAPPRPAPARARSPQATPSLLIDQPVRSGQSVIFREGDVTIVGPVASGAEVIAGGSIHVYGPLRGRAIAGVTTGASARIFCRKLEAELIAVDGLYKTAEHWGADLRGRPAQIQRDRDALIVSAFD